MCEDADTKARETITFFFRVAFLVVGVAIAMHLEDVVFLLGQMLEKL